MMITPPGARVYRYIRVALFLGGKKTTLSDKDEDEDEEGGGR
jgi:hypothetical protein